MKIAIFLCAVVGISFSAGCSKGYRIVATQTGDLISFRFLEASGDKAVTLCVDHIEVSSDAAPVWTIAASKCKNMSGFTYAEMPKEFSQGGDAAPLQKGLTYRVEVNAAGGAGSGSFTVR
jgi:hypothetical protein